MEKLKRKETFHKIKKKKKKQQEGSILLVMERPQDHVQDINCRYKDTTNLEVDRVTNQQTYLDPIVGSTAKTIIRNKTTP